jgi:hypothetical protein
LKVEEIYSLAEAEVNSDWWPWWVAAGLCSAGRVGHPPLHVYWLALAPTPPSDSERVQVCQQILHLLLRHDLAKPRHHIPAGRDHLAHAVVIGRHPALRQELLFEYAL